MNGIRGLNPIKVRIRLDRRQTGPLTGNKPKIRAQRFGDQKDVRKQDRSIKTIATDRLKRHLSSQLRVVAKRQKIPSLSPRRAVLWQIAARLAHHPNRRNRLGFAIEAAKEFLSLSHLVVPMHWTKRPFLMSNWQKQTDCQSKLTHVRERLCRISHSRPRIHP